MKHWHFEAICDEDRNDDVSEFITTDNNATIDTLLSYFVKCCNNTLPDVEKQRLYNSMYPIWENLSYIQVQDDPSPVTLNMMKRVIFNEELYYHITISEMQFLDLTFLKQNDDRHIPERTVSFCD